MATFNELKPEYTYLWKNMVTKADKSAAVTEIAKKLIGKKARYLSVAAKTGVPWHVIAALHNRESDADFTTYLGNGQPLSRKTTETPKGRGPFKTWEDGAIDALKFDGLDQITDWSPERACFELEVFNGFGYRGQGINSPYLWSFTNHYTRGKYTETPRRSVYRPELVDAQCGAVPVMRRIMELDASAQLGPQVIKPTPGVSTVILLGAGGTGIAGYFGAHAGVIAVALAITAVLAISTYFITHRSKD